MQQKKYDIAVIGCGYVGLTLAVCLAKANQKVLGVEKRQDIVNTINSGRAHFYEAGLNRELKFVVDSGKLMVIEKLTPDFLCDTYIITVGTPLKEDGKVNMDMIRHATKEVAENMKDGALIIVRSTVKIGTSRDIVQKTLNETGKKTQVAMCPERTLEGRALKELRELPQIIGADTKEARISASNVFNKLTKAPIIYVNKLETAEIIKLTDNSYRDVQFAFANEIARVCESYEVSAYDVVTQGKLGYERTNVPLPGPVGGPCLEKDSHIFLQSAQEKGIDLEIIQSSRLVNERQPRETVQFIAKKATELKYAPDIEIALMGMAFKGKPANDDLRGSMSVPILNQLREFFPKARIKIFDAEVSQEVLKLEFFDTEVFDKIEKIVKNTKIVIIANNHAVFENFGLDAMQKNMIQDGFIYDYWNVFSNLSEKQKRNYFSVGATV